MSPRLVSLIVAGCLAAAPVLAQTTPPVSGGLSPSASSPTGGIPPAGGGAGDRTGSVTSSGQTKPPGAPVGDALGTRSDVEERSRQVDRQIGRGICQGC